MSISRLCFSFVRVFVSFRLRRMFVLHHVSIRTLYEPEALCRLGSYGEVDAASFRSASLRAQPRAQSSERGVVATGEVIS